ncbi:acetylcholine receptor subunit alpha-type acr-16-like [Cylas formicarius]|uniref:acetylcholine receptor subunit alpha-type acr-16-like n=1 Tax=Cylas formicarius TaxID=197179 RepID=UPI00295834CE|nr:acetylcholine receptor subunit alpha-type acr-16-like [Cylas formicarius]
MVIMSGDSFCGLVIFSVSVFTILGYVQCGFMTTKIGPQPIWNSTFTDKLRRDLLLNYDKFARPAQHYNTTRVKLGMSIRHIELNEFKSTLTVHSWFRLTWQDEKLKWDSTKYGGLTSLNLADHEIWQPDIFLYNSATSTPLSHYNTHCIVYDNGEVLWVPPVQFSVLCNLNLKYWPFDTQECKMKFGSWTYNGDQIDIDLMNNKTEVELAFIIENNEWEITKTSLVRNVTYYSCCESPYPDITISLMLKRASPSYKTIIVTPAFVIIILTLLCFWLPPNCGEKIIINGCTAIIVCLFLLYFTQKMPAMGTHTPLIVLFYSSCLYIVAFSMVGSVAVITLTRSRHTTSLPWIVKQPLTGKFGKYLGLTGFIQQSSVSVHRVTAEEMRDHQVAEFEDLNASDESGIVRPHHHSGKAPIQEDWILLGAAIDRISFIFYSLLFLILSIVYSI